MSKVSLDLSKFKHIKSDKHSTTLQHKDGHVLTIASKALSPEFRSQLSALSGISKAAQTPEQANEAHDQKYADGGDVKSKDKGVIDNIVDTVKEAFAEPTPKPGARPAPTPNPKKARDFGKAFNTDEYAKGGEVAGNPKLQESKKKPEGDKLDYKNFGKEFNQKSRQYQIEDRAKPRKMLAEGGDPAADDAMGRLRIQQAIEQAQSAEPEVADTSGADRAAYEDKLASFNGGLSNPAMQTVASNVAPSMPEEQQPMQEAETPSADPVNDEAEPPEAPARQPAAAQPVPRSVNQAQQQNSQQNESAQPQQVAKPTFADHKMQAQQALSQEDAAWSQDLANGHIQPKTYNSLFADQSTLGKIGTIFGLMVSGVGSGVTKQPNAMLELMNKQIENDLSAQKQSKENAQNFIKLGMQNQVNQGSLRKMVQDGQLTEAQAKATLVDAGIHNDALAHMRANRAAFHSLVDKVDAMPMGSPQRAAAEQQLALLNNSVDTMNADIADKAASASAYARVMLGQSQQAGGAADSSEQGFQNQVRGMKMLGDPRATEGARDLEQKHVSGVPGQASRPIADKDRDTIQAMNVLDAKGKDVLNFIQQHKGTLNPSQLAQASQKIEEMKNFYNESIKGGALTEGRLGWYDEQFGKSNPTGRLNQFLGGKAKLQEMVDSNQARKQSLLEFYGFPVQDTQQSQPQYKTVNGVKYMRGPNGQAIPVK